MTLRRFAHATAIALCFGCAHANLHADTTNETPQAQFDEAMRLAQEGSRDDARVLFANSADGFSTQAQLHASAGLWFNAGNAFVQAGDTGRGIAALLRAQALAPADASIAANLEEARRTREALTPTQEPQGIARIAPSWRFIAEPTRAWLALLGWGVFWSGVCALLMLDLSRERARGAWKIALATGALLGCTAGATVLGDRLARSGDARAVIIAREVLPKKGNGESFAPAVEDALHAGAECIVLSTRPDWTEISLSSDVRGWVPSAAVERLW